jgi:uncharacterized coiled-coil protein SlyX
MPKNETLTARVKRLEELHAETEKSIQALANAQIQSEERISRLVSAIGELISHMPPIRPNPVAS